MLAIYYKLSLKIFIANNDNFGKTLFMKDYHTLSTSYWFIMADKKLAMKKCGGVFSCQMRETFTQSILKQFVKLF